MMNERNRNVFFQMTGGKKKTNNQKAEGPNLENK